MLRLTRCRKFPCNLLKKFSRLFGFFLSSISGFFDVFSRIFNVSHVNEKFCFWVQKYLKIELSRCKVYSIWRFKPTEALWDMQSFAVNKCFCNHKVFPYIYWIVLLSCVFGLLHCLTIFLCTWNCETSKVTTWRRKNFYVIKPEMLRHFRILGSFLNTCTWFFLLYGIIAVRPNYMIPWLILFATMISFEFIFWLYHILLGYEFITMDQVFRFILPTFLLISVCCINRVMSHAVATRNTYSLRILTKSLKTLKKKVCILYCQFLRK